MSWTSSPAHPTRWASWGLLQICLAGVLAGTAGLTAQLVQQGTSFSAITLASYRVGGGAVVTVLTVLVLRRLADLRRLVARHPRRIAAIGLLTGSVQALYFAAVALVGVTISTVVALGLAPVLLMVRDSWRRHRRPGLGALAQIGVALCGLALVSGAVDHIGGGPHPVAGLLAAMATGTAYAVQVALSESIARTASPLSLTTASSVVAALALIPPTALLGGPTSYPIRST